MPGSPYTDLDRPPLSQAALTRALIRPGALWTGITVVESTGSTNADLAQDARGGAPEGTILVAEVQRAGRGRHGRTWSAPPRSALTFSFLLRPTLPATAFGWLPLLAGVGVVSGLRRVAEVEARLKWPNDVLIGERKLAGILAERVGDAVVIGIGLNVSLREPELPVPTATSLAIENAVSTDREPLLKAILRSIESSYREFTAAGGNPDASGLRAAYLAASATVGQRVRVYLPGDQVLTGHATGIDPTGQLLITPDPSGPEQAISAGDVIHVRPSPS